MSQEFKPGDFLIFQIESGFGLLKLLAIDTAESGEQTWHVLAFEELFLDPEMADMALENTSNFSTRRTHLVLTQRAFDATQVARMKNEPVSGEELAAVDAWRSDPGNRPSDTSARLLLGLR
jgi:hypothetical protein